MEKASGPMKKSFPSIICGHRAEPSAVSRRRERRVGLSKARCMEKVRRATRLPAGTSQSAVICTPTPCGGPPELHPYSN
ncbi:hypothetical protein FQN60_011519, partial [Etheostoma spectabile]